MVACGHSSTGLTRMNGAQPLLEGEKLEKGDVDEILFISVHVKKEDEEAQRWGVTMLARLRRLQKAWVRQLSLRSRRRWMQVPNCVPN